MACVAQQCRPTVPKWARFVVPTSTEVGAHSQPVRLQRTSIQAHVSNCKPRKQKEANQTTKPPSGYQLTKFVRMTAAGIGKAVLGVRGIEPPKAWYPSVDTCAS
eukprot:1422549-Amphidinium_carterae.1